MAVWRWWSPIVSVFLVLGCGGPRRREIRLTLPVIEDGKASGQRAKFEIGLPRESGMVPLEVEITVRCGASQASTMEAMRPHFRCRVEAVRSDGRGRLTRYKVFPESAGAFEKAEIRDGVMRGSFPLDVLAIKKEIEKKLASELRSDPGLTWKVRVIIGANFDNTGFFGDRRFGRFLREDRGMIPLRAGCTVEWMRWTYPKGRISFPLRPLGTAPPPVPEMRLVPAEKAP